MKLFDLLIAKKITGGGGGGGEEAANTALAKLLTDTGTAIMPTTHLIVKNITQLAQQGLYGKRNLVSVSMPDLEVIGQYGLALCSNLETVEFPSVQVVNSYAFKYSSKLDNVELPSAMQILAEAFSGCSALASITLSGRTVCSLANPNAFSNSGITSTTGAIYVPADLVDTYKAATNWSVFADRIFPIED